MDITKIIGTIAIGVLGPLLCYILVYGSISLMKYVYLSIKAICFRKKMMKANTKKKEDEFSDIDDNIQVDIVSSVKEENNKI